MTMLPHNSRSRGKEKRKKKKKKKTLLDHTRKAPEVGGSYRESIREGEFARETLFRDWESRRWLRLGGGEWLRSSTRWRVWPFDCSLKGGLRSPVLQNLKSEGNWLEGERNWGDRSRTNGERLEGKENVGNLGFSQRAVENCWASLIFRVERKGIKGNENELCCFFLIRNALILKSINQWYAGYAPA